MNLAISLPKYLLVCAIGFGLGGALWGLILFNGIPQIEFPFHYLAIIIMGLASGVSLSLFSKSLKEISKSVLAGLLGYGIGFFSTAVFIYPLSISGVLFLSIIPSSLIEAEFINLDPYIGVGGFWLLFLFSGAIIGLFYALFLKTKIWALIWRTGLGFALGSLISPIIGNLLGNLFNCLLIKYLITFSLIGIILGIFLAWGIYKNQQVEISEEKT